MRHLQSESFNKKKRLRMWFQIVGSIAVILIIIYGISWLFRLSFLTISDVSVFGADADISTEIHDTVLKQIQGTYFGFFPRANILIYPKSSIIHAIQSQFPRVLDVSVRHDGLQHLQITVSDKNPVAIVCSTLPNFDGDIFSFNQDDPCYLADSDGLLFEKSPTFSGHPYHIYYAPDLIGTSSDSAMDFIGSYATSTDEFHALQSFYDATEKAGIPGDAVLIKQGGEYELYSSSTIIYFNDRDVLSAESANLSVFWNSMMHSGGENAGGNSGGENGDTTKGNPLFDYIDLRFAPNVFYKITK